jgi:hypothetical protein
MKTLTRTNADKIAKLVFDLAISENQTPEQAQDLCEYFWLVATGHELDAQEFRASKYY